MSDTILSVELTISNQKGLHARAAAAFVKTVEVFDAFVEVEKSGNKVGGTSIMGLMMLSASKGTIIKVFANGLQAQEAISAISELVNNKFGED